jgi:hypothetical protein
MRLAIGSLTDLRDFLSTSAPALVGSLIGFFVLDEKPVVRVFAAVFFGFLLQTAALLLYGVSCFVIARLQGTEAEKFKFDLNDKTTAALLLAVSVYGLGLYWKHEQARSILGCVREESRSSAFGQFESADDLATYCVEEYGKDDGQNSDD